MGLHLLQNGACMFRILYIKLHHDLLCWTSSTLQDWQDTCTRGISVGSNWLTTNLRMVMVVVVVPSSSNSLESYKNVSRFGFHNLKHLVAAVLARTVSAWASFPLLLRPSAACYPAILCYRRCFVSSMLRLSSRWTVNKLKQCILCLLTVSSL